MLDIQISSKASDYIHNVLGNMTPGQNDDGFPTIKYFHRSYLTTKDGKIIERGPLIHVTMIDKEELDQCEYFIATLNDKSKIYIHPVTKLNRSGYLIDIIKGRLSLIENI